MRTSRLWVAATALSLSLSACGTTLHLKSYPIETPTDTYKRLRIGVPTAAAGSDVRVKIVNVERGAASKAVIDPENILAIVQHEVMRTLQKQGSTIALVAGSPDLDLQISFEPPSPAIDLIGLLTLGSLPLFQSLGGAQLVDVKSGRILYTYEFVSHVRKIVPPTQIRDWEKFAKALAEEVARSLTTLKLASEHPVHVVIPIG